MPIKVNEQLCRAAIVCLSIFALSASGSAYGATSAGSDSSKSKKSYAPAQEKKSSDHGGTVDATGEIHSLLSALKRAITDADAVAAASLFSEDAIFIDQSGEEVHGRNALEQRFDLRFQDRQPAKNEVDRDGAIGFEPERITFPAQNVAIVVGVVSRPAASESIVLSRFSITAERHDGQWLIAQATETTIDSGVLSAHEHLLDLGWLVGDWQTTTKRAVVSMSVDWVAGGNFMRATIVGRRSHQADENVTDEEVRQAGGSPEAMNEQKREGKKKQSTGSTKNEAGDLTEIQIIGWDPRIESIVSWHFGVRGNFSYGRWKKSGLQWLVEDAGVGCEGSATRATDILIPKAADQFTWQAVNRHNGEQSLPDSEQLLVRKTQSGGPQR